MTAVIVGDANPRQVRQLAETYFGRLPKRPRPEPVRTEEPPQEGERRVMVEVASQPYVLLGYHRPSVRHPDHATLDVISDVLGGGRTSWLYKSLVKEKKIAVAASAFTGFPGYKYPGLFMFFAVPSAGHTAEEVEKAMDEQIERIKEEEVPPDRLQQVKRRARAAVLRGLRSNSGLASALAMNHVLPRGLALSFPRPGRHRKSDSQRCTEGCQPILSTQEPDGRGDLAEQPRGSSDTERFNEDRLVFWKRRTREKNHNPQMAKILQSQSADSYKNQQKSADRSRH